MKDGDRIFCDKCGFEVERLTAEEAEEDIFGHGWSNWRTAQQWVCTDCFEKVLERRPNPWPEIIYECYIADRIHPSIHENQMALEGIPARFVDITIPRRSMLTGGIGMDNRNELLAKRFMVQDEAGPAFPKEYWKPHPPPLLLITPTKEAIYKAYEERKATILELAKDGSDG